MSDQGKPQLYQSRFPGSENVRLDEVFSRPGYNEPARKAPTLATLSVICAVLSWVFPPISWGLSVAALPLSITAWMIYRQSWEYRPGQLLTRGAIAISSFTFFCLLLSAVLWSLGR